MARPRARTHKVLRWAVRLLLLAAAVLFALGGPLPVWLARAFPGASPLTALSCSLAGRRWFLGLLWALPPLVLVLVALWKGRLFCRWICPAGTLYALPARLSLKKKILGPRPGGYIFWTVLFASLAGAPLLIFLDPLSTFNRLTLPAQGIFSAAWLVLGLVLPFFLLLGFLQPMIWCTHLCPLGYFFGLCGRVGNWRKKQAAAADDDGEPQGAPSRTRREIVAGLLFGLPLAALFRKFAMVAASPERAAVLPPGAGEGAAFSAVCSRCYACVGACPERVIRVGWPVDRAPGQFFQPELDANRGYCEEFCNQCTQVCPTGALAPLTVDQKRARQIGVAVVVRQACLAWSDGEYCMVCQEYCPYDAIESSEDAQGIPRPLVDEDLCRGCGRCQHECPAIREGKAIIVHGVERQRQLDVKLWHF